MGRVSGFGELADGLARASRRPIRRSLLPLLKDIGSDIPVALYRRKQQNLLIFVSAFYERLRAAGQEAVLPPSKTAAARRPHNTNTPHEV